MLRRKKNTMIHKFNFKYTDQEYDEEEDIFYCHEQYQYISLRLKHNPPIGLHSLKYDGLRYWQLSLGFATLSWGNVGSWEVVH